MTDPDALAREYYPGIREASRLIRTSEERALPIEEREAAARRLRELDREGILRSQAERGELDPDDWEDVSQVAKSKDVSARGDSKCPEVPHFSGDTFSDTKLPAREVVATSEEGEPLLRRRMIVAVGAHRGVGKTMATSGIAVGASLGEPVFCFHFVRPFKTIVVDLELPTAEMQERFRTELRGRKGSPNWRLISSDGLDDPIGSLHSPHEVARLMPHYEWADVIVIDSATYGLSTDDDNSAAHWKPCEDFLFMLRRMDKLVIVNFHLNAQGTKIRGTTAKEQSADLVALLRRPSDRAADGCHITWGWTKRRGVTAAVAKDFETRLDPDAGWVTSVVDDTDRRHALLELLRAGMPVQDAAEEAAISRATAYRWRAEMIETGLLGKPQGWDKRRGRKA